MYNQIIKTMEQAADPNKAKVLQSFFKTKPGEYGEGDIFWGITVPRQRQFAKQFKGAAMNDLKRLLNSKIHEHRLTALLILIDKYSKSEKTEQARLVKFYLANTKFINNWDLVDLSAPKILGDYLLDKNATALFQLAKSKSLWERRIAIISTLAFIKNNNFNKTLKISKLLLKDDHDLIHKAVGWMLREVGKRDKKTEIKFLEEFQHNMPRTMLRYAIEKFPESERQKYLNHKISLCKKP